MLKFAGTPQEGVEVSKIRWLHRSPQQVTGGHLCPQAKHSIVIPQHRSGKACLRGQVGQLAKAKDGRVIGTCQNHAPFSTCKNPNLTGQDM